MLVIITNDFCPIVDKVIEWLVYYKLDFIRINDYHEEFNKICFSSDNEENFYWIIKPKSKSIQSYDDSFQQQLYYEYIQGFFKILNTDNSLGKMLSVGNYSKYQILKEASKLGIIIPKTLITNEISKVNNFIKKYGEVITKSSHDMFSYKIENKFYRSYTELITTSDIQKGFGLSMIQEHIPKFGDIKSFYLNEKFYSVLILSQDDETTKIDFRKNYDANNKIIPYQLPIEYEKKLWKLLKNCKINISVVDSILSIEGKLYFLEINVEGIFDNISYVGNYELEKIIAEFLITKVDEKKHNRKRD